jgi:tRNA(His) guanylyltransferase
MSEADVDLTLGQRMKRYEHHHRAVLPPRSYAVLRVDIRAAHSYLRRAERPFDPTFMADMDAVAEALCAEVSGAQLAYTQSDEISVVFTDLAGVNAQFWFGGTVAKQVSISAALATAVLNERREGRALFDSRVFVLPDAGEVANYLVWRQRDAERNSISMAARNLFSHRQLQGVGGSEMRDMLLKAGRPWEDLPAGFRAGRATRRVRGQRPFSYATRVGPMSGVAERTWWETSPAERFTIDSAALLPGRDAAT